MATFPGTPLADSIVGTDSNDTITGQAGNDYIDGRWGYDYMDGGDGVDTLDTRFFSGAYELNMTTGVTNYSYGGEYAFNFENVYTGAGNDRIIGNNANNYISTGAGNDWVDGGWGYDVMDGGTGVDTLDVRFFSGDYVLNMNTGVTNYSFGGEYAYNFENVYTGAGNDTIYGTSDANYINTGNGNDMIMAGAGNDVINGYGDVANGSEQIDKLNGGAGDDIFVLGTSAGGVFYVEPGNGYAVIEDWRAASGMSLDLDRVQLKGNASDYEIRYTNVLGSSTLDTEIYLKGSGMSSPERIAIIQDSTNFDLSSNYVNYV
jgi:Ca2+-binding RTX toxin-like protein